MNGTSSVWPPTTRIFRFGASAGTVIPSRERSRGVRIVEVAPVSTIIKCGSGGAVDGGRDEGDISNELDGHLDRRRRRSLGRARRACRRQHHEGKPPPARDHWKR